MGTHYHSQHLTLAELRAKTENRHNSYLFRFVPAYPRPELHVSHLSHCTNLEGLKGIKGASGFRVPGNRSVESRVVWFSLTVSLAELREAEGRIVTIVHPRAAEESVYLCDSAGPELSLQHQEDYADCGTAHRGAQKGRQEGSVLQKFASSPAFESCSRLGSFRFTLPLEDVLDKYSQQFCGGQKPVMRVWKTTLYSSKVEYVVLVHSPTNQDRFSEFPVLQKEADICGFREEPRPHFIWKPQAMCSTHSFELLLNREENSLTVEPTVTHDECGRRVRMTYNMWDCVSLALHVNNQVLRFGDMELRGSLRYCEMGDRPFRSVDFQTFEEAQAEVQKLWPLEMFCNSQFNIIL